MQRGFTLSIIFHLILGVLIIYELPALFHKEIQTDYAMVVDVVNISELTNVKVKTTDKKNDESTQTKKAPKSQDVKQDAQEKSKEKIAKADDDSEKIPVKKETPKKQEVNQEKKLEKEKKDDPKKKKKTDDFEKSILKSLDEESKKKENKKVDKEFKDLADALKGDTNKEYNDNIPMSMSEIDAIKSQITKTWNTSSFSGANSKGMEIVVMIILDMEGNVLSVQPKTSIANSSPYFQAFTDSALRAVRAASPLKNLDKEKFGSWKEIEFRFDSSGMIY